LVKKKSRFEVGTCGAVFDGSNAIAEVQTPGTLFGHGKQALEAPAQICRLADVGFRPFIAAQKENRRLRRDGEEDFVVAVCLELKPVEEHLSILDALALSKTGRQAV
jgi:hypothetical protein